MQHHFALSGISILHRRIFRSRFSLPGAFGWVKLTVASLILWAWLPAIQAGSILREVWEGIPGTAISDLTNSVEFPDHPTSTNLVTDYFEAPTDVLDNYGQRMHGYIIPPVSGS